MLQFAASTTNFNLLEKQYNKQALQVVNCKSGRTLLSAGALAGNTHPQDHPLLLSAHFLQRYALSSIWNPAACAPTQWQTTDTWW